MSMTFSGRSRYLFPAIVLGVIATGAVVGWNLVDGDKADAGPLVMLTSDNALVIQDTPSEALRRASALVGYEIPGLASTRYQLNGGSLPGTDSANKAVDLLYANPKAAPGSDRVTFIILPGTQSAVKFGRENEPDPDEVPATVAGLRVVRLTDVSGAVAFTAWRYGRTYGFVFYPPNPSDKEMLDIVMNTLR